MNATIIRLADYIPGGKTATEWRTAVDAVLLVEKSEKETPAVQLANVERALELVHGELRKLLSLDSDYITNATNATLVSWCQKMLANLAVQRKLLRVSQTAVVYQLSDFARVARRTVRRVQRAARKCGNCGQPGHNRMTCSDRGAS